MTTTVETLGPDVVGVLRDAAAWRLLSRLFECPSTAWHADVRALAADVTDADLVEAAQAAVEEASEGLYHSIFGPGGPAPPREVSYHDSLELGSVMSSLTTTYEAFGYRPAMLEAPDHVAVEAGFLGFLGAKHAYALVEGDPEHVAVTVQAARDFRTGHLAMFADRLAALLADAPASYLQVAARALARRAGPKPGPRLLPVLQAEAADDGGEFACDL